LRECFTKTMLDCQTAIRK